MSKPKYALLRVERGGTSTPTNTPSTTAKPRYFVLQSIDAVNDADAIDSALDKLGGMDQCALVRLVADFEHGVQIATYGE